MKPEDIDQLYEQAKVELKKIPNVVSVGFGYKEVRGKTINEISFRVFVKEKKDIINLSPEEVIPMEYKGIKTDVVVIDKIEYLACEDYNHYDTLIGGITISNLKAILAGTPGVIFGQALGTLGFFGTINGNTSRDNIVMLTNRHILIADGGVLGDTVYQPLIRTGEAGLSIRRNREHDETFPVGNIHNLGKMDSHSYQYQGDTSPDQFYLDCATAKVNTCFSSWCNTNCGVSYDNAIRSLQLNGSNAITGIERIRASDISDVSNPYIVIKVGRTTGRTVGKVTSISDSSSTMGTITAHNVVVIEATEDNCNNQLLFADEGDSGSVIVNRNNKIVALLFGRKGTDHTKILASHIHPVVSYLDITLLGTTPSPPAPTPTRGRAPGVLLSSADSPHFERLRNKLAQSPRGKEVFDKVAEHRSEISFLINRVRPVTVAWHRTKGPAFLGHFLNSSRDYEYVVPQQVEGVSLSQALATMAKVLLEHGSPQLRREIEHYQEWAVSVAEKVSKVEDFIFHLNAQPIL